MSEVVLEVSRILPTGVPNHDSVPVLHVVLEVSFVFRNAFSVLKLFWKIDDDPFSESVSFALQELS